MLSTDRISHPFFILAIILLQSVCAIFFIFDVVGDLSNYELSNAEKLHLAAESVASIALIVAILLEISVLRNILLRKAHLEDQLTRSQKNLHEIVEYQLREWKLTPAEFDVAMFVFKGLNPPEIAELRGTSEGTIKAQLSAVYRKADVQNRAELLVSIIDNIYLN
ncbi:MULTISPECIES: helix-turn-helix transcriptional regulator [unclassified Neptuniibacter]|uniref:helix-turn-helix transcriptional regulator n=1 Tax=unclassified Neptuniibacter TaxID=2630693 RepID=UPI000C4A154A|nr:MULTISPECIES: helix-turn-helix transcriptional regulator [unclassified Neptuniibacter]MAY42296.1 helix-turn-helix transcriptional regulator [Oceanospirillaceae bacterium]|tara:strand:+ start:1829 stop:2323 length:495 start_codon:yes stop_codon:yes gene_type:complete